MCNGRIASRYLNCLNPVCCTSMSYSYVILMSCCNLMSPGMPLSRLAIPYVCFSVLDRLQIAAWLKGEGAKLFKAGNYEKAAEK